MSPPPSPATRSVDEARERILAGIAPLPPVELPLVEALGLALAADAHARADLPPFANSAMDGFALRSPDTARAGRDAPVTLAVIGSAPAGHAPAGPVGAGEAVRIMTGAPIPAGADAVIRFEHTTSLPDGAIAIDRPVSVGENIRPAGEDARAGDRVLATGARLDAAAIGLLAASGHARVSVHPRPRVGVLVTGDEVVPPGDPLGPGQIWNSNGPMALALVAESGGVPVDLGVATDAPEALRERLAAARGLDLLVTTGGVSVGDFDIVKDVLRAAGSVELWSLRIRPGRPLAFGAIGGTPVIGLPGNPVAATLAFRLFARPAIRALGGHRDPGERVVPAVAGDRIANRGGRRQYARVTLARAAHGALEARLAGAQGSALLTTLARAEGLLVIPEHVAEVAPGDPVDVLLLD